MSMKKLTKLVSATWSHPLNLSLNDRIKAISRMLRWQLATRILPESLHALPFVNGSLLIARRGDVGVTGNWYNGLDEPSEMVFLLRFLRTNDLFIDVGANIGSFTILACSIAGVRAVAYEPIPQTASKLRRNILVNDFTEVAECRMVGVSDRPNVLSFTSHEDSMNHVVSQSDKDLAGTISVEVVTLDDEFATLPEDQQLILKIDVEGHENEVIDGAIKILSRNATTAVIMETNGSGARYGVTDFMLFSKLEQLGFTPCRYCLDKGELIEIEQPCENSINTLFIKHFADVKLKNLYM